MWQRKGFGLWHWRSNVSQSMLSTSGVLRVRFKWVHFTKKKFLLCARVMCVLKRMYRVFLNKFYFTSKSLSLSTQSSCMHNLPHFPQISNGWDFEIKLFFEWPIHWQPKYNHFVHYFHRRGIEFSHYGPCMNTSATAEKCPSSCARSLLSGAVCGSNGNVYPSECDMKRQTCG